MRGREEREGREEQEGREGEGEGEVTLKLVAGCCTYFTNFSFISCKVHRLSMRILMATQ